MEETARAAPDERGSSGGWDYGDYLSRAAQVVVPRHQFEGLDPLPQPPTGALHVGADLGTAYVVLVALDESGAPLAGEWQFAEVVRDGLVVDYIGAVDLLRGMKARLERYLGRELETAVSGYPPGVHQVEVRATANVVEAAGLACPALLDEPTAANNVLGLHNGVIVDVGGGTTGIAVIEDGKVVYTADEATGGTHFTLVVAGALNVPFEEAEALKTNPAEQARLYPLVVPVMEKVAAITARHLNGVATPQITLVGGSSAFPGFAAVVAEVTGIKTVAPQHPHLVTPLGLARHLLNPKRMARHDLTYNGTVSDSHVEGPP